MKRLMIGLLTTILLLAVGAIGLSARQFARWAPPDTPMPDDPQALAWFIDSYEEASAAFRAQSADFATRFNGVEQWALPVASATRPDLTLDILYIPAQREPRHLIILASGVHGSEGATGSAVTRMVLDEFVTAEQSADTGFLILHAVNPFGFAAMRRVTENNVDLNRNASHGADLYRTDNAGYHTVNSMVNPTGPANPRTVENRFFPVKAVAMIARHSMATLRQAVLQGQYQYERGIYYGGQALEPQLRDLPEIVTPIINRYPLAMVLDLHTGYGERGTLHIFPVPPKNEAVRQGTEALFPGYQIDWGDTGDFYTVTGDFASFVGELKRDGLFLPIALEYGTLDSQTTMGSIKSLHVSIMENQGFQYGYASERDETKIKADYREMFYPSSADWRIKAIHDSRDLFRTLFANLGNLTP